MRVLAVLFFINLLGLASADDTTLSPEGKAIMQNDTLRIVGSVKEQRPHGYIIEIPARPPADGAKDVFVLTDARAAVGDSVDWTVYFIGEYDYPTNDTGDSVRIAKTTDKIGVAADYVLKKGISDVSSELSMYR